MEYLENILAELIKISKIIDSRGVEKLINNIMEAEKIFFTASGRSLLSIKAFAMRLMQLGFIVHIVGDVSTPAITKNDLLIIASGSGETQIPLIHSIQARKVGARIHLISTNENSSISKYSNDVLCVPASTTKLKYKENISTVSMQQGGSLFEQVLLLLGDSIVMTMQHKNYSRTVEGDIMTLHANLE